MKMKISGRAKKILFRSGLGLLVLIFLVLGGFYVYTLDYYRADKVAAGTEVSQEEDKYYLFEPSADNDKDTGFIFYPGGKVEALAYAPLMKQLSDEGLIVVLVKMPFNLAVFDSDAADGIVEEFAGVDNWYIGGHSLGGAMASSYLEKTDKDFKGLVLLGAYTLGEVKVPILPILGSEDKIVDRKRADELDNPYIIQGGNHGNFGNYGVQDGDGKSTISREEQQSLTVEAIMEFIEVD